MKSSVFVILTFIVAYVRADADNSATKFVTAGDDVSKNDQSSSATQQEKRSLVEGDYVNGAALAEAAHYSDESAALGYAYNAPLPVAHPAEPVAVAHAAPLDPSIALQFAHLQHIPNPAVAVAPNLYTEAHLNDHLPLSTGYAPAFSGVQVAGPLPYGEQVVHQQVEINRPVPVPIIKTVAVAVPHPVPVAVPQPFAVEVPHPVPYEVKVPVIKTVPYPVEKHIPVPIEKPYPVKIIKKVPVPVPKPYPVHIPIYKVKHIYHHEPKW